jgi:cell division protein FtsX
MTVGTLLLVRSVLKNKKALYGYNLTGAILTFTALLFLFGGFLMSYLYASAAFVLVTITYWGVVVFFKLKSRKQ